MSNHLEKLGRLRTALITLAAVLGIAAMAGFLLYRFADQEQGRGTFEWRPSGEPVSARFQATAAAVLRPRISLEHIATFPCPVPNDGFKGNPRWVHDCCFLSGGERICVANWGAVSILEARTGRLIRTLDARMLPRTAVALDPERTLIATTETDLNSFADPETRVRLWDASTGDFINTLAELNYVFESVAFDSATSRLIVAGGHQADFEDSFTENRHGVSRIELWDVERRVPTGELGFAGGFVECVDATNGTLVAASGREVVLWDLVGDQKIDSWKHRHGAYSAAVAIGPRGQVVASVSTDDYRAEVVVRTQIQERTELSRLILRDMSTAVAIAPSEDYIAVGDGRLLRLLALDRSTITKTEQSGVVSTLAFSEDGALLASGGSDGQVNVWRVVRADAGGPAVND